MMIVDHFAAELGRYRELTEDEVRMLTQRSTCARIRRVWTRADDRQLARLRAERFTAEQIAARVGRTAFSVRSRIRQLARSAG